jgi:hypothetical protein
MKNKDQLIEAKQKVDTFQLEAGWYDLWHIHLDNWGQGNKSIAEHRKFIVLFLDLLCRVTDQAKTIHELFQTWLIIDPTDSYKDSLYFHTPNPNGNNFPYDFSTINWEIEYPDLLFGIIESKKYMVGESHFDGFLIYFIKLK